MNLPTESAGDPVLRLVHLRQRFVRRCHGRKRVPGAGGPDVPKVNLGAQISSPFLFGIYVHYFDGVAEKIRNTIRGNREHLERVGPGISQYVVLGVGGKAFHRLNHGDGHRNNEGTRTR
jgi:hypothetical protein